MRVEDQVREFHLKHGFDVGLSLSAGNDGHDETRNTYMLNETYQLLKSFSERWESGKGSTSGPYSPRLFRAHLILEEVAETLKGLAERDDVRTLDGLADSNYVLAGTAVTFGLPYTPATDEVQRSNMTKAKRDGRLRDKGPDYEPPNLEAVLAMHREAGEPEFKPPTFTMKQVGEDDVQVQIDLGDGEQVFVCDVSTSLAASIYEHVKRRSVCAV